MCVFKLSCQSSFSLFPTPPYCCIQHIFIRFKCVKSLFPKKMVPTHHNVAVLQITFGHCTMSAPTVQTLILKSLILCFITSTNGGFAAQMSFQERKLFSALKLSG